MNHDINELIGTNFSIHRLLELHAEIFEYADLPMIRYGELHNSIGICGSRGFIFADCIVSKTESRARLREIIKGRNVKVSLSTTRYSTLYAGVRWLWPLRTRGMGSISCFIGSNKSIRKAPNVVFVISVPKTVIPYPKRNPEVYRECLSNREDFLAMLGGFIDGDGSISVYWSKNGRVRREVSLATADKWFADLIYKRFVQELDPDADYDVIMRDNKKNIYRITSRKIKVIEELEPYIYHPIKRIKAALALGSHGKYKRFVIKLIRDKNYMKSLNHVDLILSTNSCKRIGYRIYAEALLDITQ